MPFEFFEGSTPLDDQSGLLIPWVQNMTDLSRVEAENIFQAQRKLLTRSIPPIHSWFNVEKFKKIHHSMFGNVWSWAGKLRESQTSIGVASHLIPMHLADFCKEVVSWSVEPIELTFLEKSARIHHRLVFIHPFENGNGRFSRLIADRCLISWHCSHPIWPSQMFYNSPIRNNYIQSLKAADHGDYFALIDLMKQFGASDPSLGMLFSHRFFKKNDLKGAPGLAFIRALLRMGQKPNPQNQSNSGLLHSVIGSKFFNLDQKLELLRLFLKEHAEINAKNSLGLTPYQLALKLRQNDIASFLLALGGH